MSERRWNPVLGEWVITATHRQDRTFLPPAEYCPLCPTRQGGDPTEIGRPDFEIAVFDNRFPSLRRDPDPPAIEGTGLTPVAPSSGACEVVVYTPRHSGQLGTMSVRHVRRLIAVWAHRTLILGGRDEVAYVFAFENRGEQIGVTLHHPHGQIYAYPMIPPVLEREVASAADHRERTGGCLWCDLNTQESAEGRRIVARAGGWLATVPFFARWPYEVHLTSERHVGWLHELDAGEVDGLARVLLTVIRKYDALFDMTLPYIMAIHQRPTDGGDHDGYHLHVEFYPPNRTATKLKYLAGSEAGAGAYINDTLPEETAATLRDHPPFDPAALDEGAS
jgi:UDPglucose--hexose-1-phosphate uridylyltransferase